MLYVICFITGIMLILLDISLDRCSRSSMVPKDRKTCASLSTELSRLQLGLAFSRGGSRGWRCVPLLSHASHCRNLRCAKRHTFLLYSHIRTMYSLSSEITHKHSTFTIVRTHMCIVEHIEDRRN